MKVLMDGRNHGAGANTSKPCGVVVDVCAVKTDNPTCNGPLVICTGVYVSKNNSK